MAEYLPQLMLAWSIQLMGVISPGPSVMLILGVATSQGRVPSLVTAFGVACGSIILSTATVLGVAAILAGMADLVVVIRLVGAGYLFWLAYRSFRKAAVGAQFAIPQPRLKSASRAWLSGFLLQVSNPKAIFFWLAVAGVGGVGDAPPSVVALFIAGAFANSFIGHGAYALLLSSGPVRGLYLRFRRWVEGALGCFFLFAGFKLVTAKN